MDIGKSFTFVFEDPQWLNKVLIGAVIILISIPLSAILVGLLGFAIVTGYSLETLRNARRGDPYPMPEWRDRWGEWTVLGLKVLVATFVWALPAILLGIFMSVGFSLTESNSGAAQAVGGLIGASFACLMFLWILVVLLATPRIYIELARTERLSSAFQFGDILAFTREHIGDVIVALIVYVVASFVIGLAASILGVLLCGIGLIITVPAGNFITMLVEAHLFAQVGRRPSSALEPLEV